MRLISNIFIFALMKKKMKFNTRAIHGGQILDPAYGSVMTPIYQTSTYAQSSPGKHKGMSTVEPIIQQEQILKELWLPLKMLSMD